MEKRLSRSGQRALEAYPVKMVNSPIGYKESVFDMNALCRHIYQEGYEQAEKDLAMSYPMPEDTTIFQKGVAEGRRLEREDWINLIADLLFFEYFIQNMPNRGWGKDSTNNNTKEI